MKTTDKYTFFWKSNEVFSQWHPSKFDDPMFNISKRFDMPGFKFKNAEQYMMFRKADMFHDEKSAREILLESDPRIIKGMGRGVRKFVKSEWDAVSFQIVKKGSYLKFSQNPKMLEKLIATGKTKLVEASPKDDIWGIGLSEDDPRALDESKWLGQNLLGKALTEVRDEFFTNQK